MSDFEFEPDPWLYVQTNTAESARKFFGVEPTREVKFVGFSEDERKKGRIFAVKSNP